ncbi:MAG: hypothetical protein H6854_00860 [Rhodospirillales bacterium]|nr:hypothetical protein [Rhodospirillales bacterium]
MHSLRTKDGNLLPTKLTLRFTTASDGEAIAHLFTPERKNKIDPLVTWANGQVKGFVVKRDPALHEKTFSAGRGIILEDPATGIIHGITMGYDVTDTDLSQHLHTEYGLTPEVPAIEIGTSLSAIPGAGKLLVAAMALREHAANPETLITTEIMPSNGRSMGAYSKYFTPLEQGPLTDHLHNAVNKDGVIAPEDQGNETEWLHFAGDGRDKARSFLRTCAHTTEITLMGHRIDLDVMPAIMDIDDLMNQREESYDPHLSRPEDPMERASREWGFIAPPPSPAWG